MASRMARAKALKADSALHRQEWILYENAEATKGCMCVPVVIIFAAKDIDMKGDPRGHCKGVEDVGEHLTR